MVKRAVPVSSFHYSLILVTEVPTEILQNGIVDVLTEPTVCDNKAKLAEVCIPDVNKSKPN